MDEQSLLNLAEQMGFAAAAIIDTKDLTFNPAFRPLCAENLCGKYGVNYACPPDCGSVEDMDQKLLHYKKALVLQTIWDIDDPLDSSLTKPAKAKHNKLIRALIDKSGMDGLMVGASGCNLCPICAITEGKPCRFPELQFSCMSAYCIFVKALAETCGMDYDCGPGLIGFFGMFCF